MLPQCRYQLYNLERIISCQNKSSPQATRPLQSAPIRKASSPTDSSSRRAKSRSSRARRNLRQGGIQAQTRQSLNNIKGVLEAAGSSMDQVVKTTVFLADIKDFAEFNAVYGEFFPQDPPARSTVQAGGLPVGALVEIEAIALLE